MIGKRFRTVILKSVAVKLAEYSSAISLAAASVGRLILRNRGPSRKFGRMRSDANASACRSGSSGPFAKLQTSRPPQKSILPL